VVFGGNVTLTNAPGTATFGKTAFFTNAKAITLTAAGSIITLRPYAGLAVGTPADSVPDVYSMVIRNSGAANLTLTPAAGTVLAFSTGKGITQSGSITIGGTAALIPGSTYTVVSTASLKIANDATLTLAAGVLATENPSGITATTSGLVLTGASSNGATLEGTGTGSLKAGATTITGKWQAVGASGTVTIAATGAATSSITGATTVALTAVASGDGVITPAAVASNNLTIAAATEIALNSEGSIKLTHGAVAANGGKIAFTAAGAKITTGNTTTGGNTGGIADVTDTGVAFTSTGSSGNKLTSIAFDSGAGSIAASSTSDDVTIDKNTDVTT
jgi:hypothetical protein